MDEVITLKHELKEKEKIEPQSRTGYIFLNDDVTISLKNILKHSNHEEEEDRKKLRELEEEDRKKFRQLEDRQRRNNLRIHGLQENDGESWDDTKKKVLDQFENKPGVRNVVIERAHRIGKKNEEKNTNKLAGTGIYINEEFSYETRMIRKKLFGEMKTHRAEGKYAIVLYDKLIVREFRDRIANA
ncbi:uncharacterized protein LOC130642163 [Hydractinia symbiolongicarpus]|uniref:uncharacterized protein LOC130642163 n=1 Tax=Hydractinia symbiolongicarpus TaxID=13093 RepID=UPI0025514C3D|nr:uncharacterized protein LOC130642163 [Hydractinia symbiolongicarpus]